MGNEKQDGSNLLSLEASILDRAATSVGEMQLYIGDDGLIYSFKG